MGTQMVWSICKVQIVMRQSANVAGRSDGRARSPHSFRNSHFRTDEAFFSRGLVLPETFFSRPDLQSPNRAFGVGGEGKAIPFGRGRHVRIVACSNKRQSLSEHETGSQLRTFRGMERTVRIRQSHTARSVRRETRIAERVSAQESEAGLLERMNLIRFAPPSRTTPEGTGVKFTTSDLLTGVVILRDRPNEQVRKPPTDGGVGHSR